MLAKIKSWFVLRRPFRPGVFYNDQERLTEIVLKDCFTVWCPLAANTGHFVDLGYDSEGQLVGIRIWGDVREQDSPTRFLLEGVEQWKKYAGHPAPTNVRASSGTRKSE